MFDRVYPARRPARPLLPGNVAASLAFHVVVLAVAGISLPVYVSEQVTEGILFFAPLPVTRAEPSAQRLTYLDVPGGGNGQAVVGPVDVFADGPPATEGQAGTDVDEGSGTEGMGAFTEIPTVNLDSVYFPDEVDNPAAYDPRSAAPAYPDSLQSAGIEGSVTARFIVDTTGRAAESTLVIVSATHPRFAQSVRDVFPRLLFRPADIRGSRIRQLVEQTFTFRLPRRSSSAGADSTAGGQRPSTIPPPGPSDVGRPTDRAGSPPADAREWSAR